MAGESGQILQQIEQLLVQLAQEQPDPQVQRAVQAIQQQIEPLQQVMGAQQAQNQQGGLNNPGAPGEAMGAGGGEGEGTPPLPGGGPHEGAGAPPGGHEGGHSVPVLAIHVGEGGPKSFGAAKKAAMATHRERGHFDRNTPKGETPSTPRTKAKAKG